MKKIKLKHFRVKNPNLHHLFHMSASTSLRLHLLETVTPTRKKNLISYSLSEPIDASHLLNHHLSQKHKKKNRKSFSCLMPHITKIFTPQNRTEKREKKFITFVLISK